MLTLPVAAPKAPVIKSPSPCVYMHIILNCSARRPRSVSSRRRQTNLGLQRRQTLQACAKQTIGAAHASGPKVVGLGLACWDFLAQLEAFPKPDQKLRTQRLEARGGGNCANALTAAARLGLDPHLVTRVGGDNIGEQIVSELAADNVKTQYVLKDRDASHFSYMMVDKQGGSRTCIQTVGVELDPADLNDQLVNSILQDTQLVYFDGRFPESAVILAKAARQKQIPVLVECERPRDKLDELLLQADYLCTSAHFPEDYTGKGCLGDAMLSILQQLPQAKWMITTLGKRGSVLLQQQQQPQQDIHSIILDDEINAMLSSISSSTTITSSGSSGSNGGSSGSGSSSSSSSSSSRAQPPDDESPDCLSRNGVPIRSGSSQVSQVFKLDMKHKAAADAAIQSDDAPAVVARIIAASAAQVPLDAIEDTTGAGDAFIGSVLYGITQKMPLDKMMRLGALVAACNCTALGARPALPHAEDIRPELLASDVQKSLQTA